MRLIFDCTDVSGYRGRWLRLRYSQSFTSAPVRPLLRFHSEDGAVAEHVLPAAALGRARWIGRVPRDLVRIALLADTEAGAIRIDAARAMGPGALAATLLRHSPTTLVRLLPLLSRTEHVREVRVRSGLDIVPLHRFARFAATRRRPVEAKGFDALGPGAPEISLILACPAAEERGLHETLATLAAQADDGFDLRLGIGQGIDRDGIAQTLRASRLADRTRLVALDPGLAPEQAALALARDAVRPWCVLLAGDRLAPEAVLALRAHLRANPALRVLYTDSASCPDGRGERPQLKPDWSPELFRSTDYLGRLRLFSTPPQGASLRELVEDAAREPGRIGHLRRVLVHLRGDDRMPLPPATPRPSPPLPAPRVSIVIPTRDRAALLRRTVESIRARTDYPDYQVVIADNDSTDPDALAYLDALRARPDTVVLPQPGAFNYARMVNRATAVSDGAVVVLLNNDMEVVDPAWLSAMVAHAVRDGVGAVGAKLLYPDGTIQHAGVALGMGEYAGHRYRRLPRDFVDEVGRLAHPHEVAAVTAACLAVTRERFDAVGGFEERLAVAFNDIDFCLKLRARGLRNLLTPDAVVMHEESASRGRDVGAKRERFLAEARLFSDRWRAMIQDDPYYHPLLSVSRFTDMLG